MKKNQGLAFVPTEWNTTPNQLKKKNNHKKNLKISFRIFEKK